MAIVDLVDVLGKVEADLTARRTSGALEHALTRWQTRHEELTGFADPGGLIAFIREPDVERRESKDKALAALCVEGIGGDNEATLLLVWLMLPGLVLLRRRLMMRHGLDSDDLDAELLTGCGKQRLACVQRLPTWPRVCSMERDGVPLLPSGARKTGLDEPNPSSETGRAR